MRNTINTYANAYRGLSHSSWWLSLVMLVNRMGTMVLPFMTLYLTESQHLPLAKAGLVVTIFGVGTLIGGFLGGKLTDIVGFYFVQLFALIGGGILFIILGQTHDYKTICGLAFILSIVNESFRPANVAAIAHYSDQKSRTRSVTLNRLAINLGWAIGGALGGFVASKSYHLLFWIDGLTNISAAVLLWLLLAPSKNLHSAHKKEEKEEIIYSAYKDRPFLIFILLNTVFAICFLQIFTTVPVFLKQDLLLEENHIGMILALNGLIIAVVEMFLIHKLEGKRDNVTYMMVGTVLVALGFILLNVIPGIFSVAMVFILFVTFGEIIQMPFAATYWINRTTHRNRGQYAGLFTISWATAQIIGPWMGTQVAQYYGFSTLWWIIGIGSLVTILGYKWIKDKPTLEEMD